MNKRTRLLAAPLLYLVSVPYLAACSADSNAGSGNAGVGGSAGGSNASGGVGMGGIAAGGSATNPGAGGSSTAMGGTESTTATGGKSANSGGASAATGGKSANSGGASAATGGKSANSGGASAATGGKSANSGGASAATGGKSANSGGASAATGGKSANSGGASGATGGKSGAGGTTANSSTTTGGGSSTGGSGAKCTIPNFPEASALPVNKKLPDPFTFFDGTKVTTKAQWECRAQEIRAMAAKYIYAPVPTAPDSTTGTVSGSNVSMTVKVGSKSDTFSATISGSGSAIALELSGGIFPSSHKKLSFGSGFEGKIRSLYGFSSDVNPNIANGWMIDRVMDVLEQNPSSGHDPTKVMVSGCSGCGKGAYLAGVFSRAPLVIIVESGGGGAANLRQAEWFRHGDGKSVWKCADAAPQSIDNLESNGICGPWITSTANWLVSAPSKVNNLPFDTHLLLASIAPRYLLHFSNNNGTNSWCHLGGTCEALSAWAAKPVWKALGIPERMGFHMYSANHCGNPAEATTLANEFFKRAFDGNTSAKTDVMDIQSNGVQQPVSEWEPMWIDWDMDTVLN